MTIRWGIVAAGKISNDFVNAVNSYPDKGDQVIAAVAARDRSRAEEFAKKHNIPKVFSSYAEMAKSNDIDIAYIGALNADHYELSKLFLESGKNVLCEKPLCLNYKQAESLLRFAKSKNLFMMEALWSRFAPAYIALEKEIQSGKIGEPQFVEATFGLPIATDEVVSKKENAGSAIMDFGVYVIQFAQYIFEDDPIKITATGELNKDGLDLGDTIVLEYSGGRRAVLNINIKTRLWNNATVVGTDGKRLTVEDPFHFPDTLIHVDGRVEKFKLHESKLPYVFENSAGLIYEVLEVARCLKEGLKESPRMSHKKSLQIAKILEAARHKLGVYYDADDDVLHHLLVLMLVLVTRFQALQLQEVHEQVTIRWGIVSAGLISNDFVNAVNSYPDKGDQVIAAVAARDRSRAEEFAKTHNIPKVFSSYAEMAKSNDIDIAYIGARNADHYELSKLFLESGKHVLCEKPLCLNYKQTESLLNVAKSKNLFMMEALWSRFAPAYIALEKEIQSGNIGEPQFVEATFGLPIGTDDVVSKNKYASSAIMDFGVYVIQFAQYIFKDDPIKITATGELYKEGLDSVDTIVLEYSGGRQAVLNINNQEKLWNNATVVGTNGKMIMVEDPFHFPDTIVHADGQVEKFKLHESKLPYVYKNSAGLIYEVLEVARCLKEGLKESPRMSHQKTLQIAKILEAARHKLGVHYNIDDEVL